MDKDTGQPARSTDVAPREVQPASLLQFKQSLAHMSYDEQVAAIQPDMPVLLNAGALADSEKNIQRKQVQREENSDASGSAEAGVGRGDRCWTFWGFAVGDDAPRAEHEAAFAELVTAARERVREAGLLGSRYYLAFDWVEGWASPEGGERMNTLLSRDRAESVVTKLLEPSSRTDDDLQLSVGGGESGDPNDPSEWHFERRVEVFLRPVSDLEEEQCEVLTATGCAPLNEEEETVEHEEIVEEDRSDAPSTRTPEVGLTLSDQLSGGLGSEAGQIANIALKTFLPPIALVLNFFTLPFAGARYLFNESSEERAQGVAYGFGHSLNGTFDSVPSRAPRVFSATSEPSRGTVCGPAGDSVYFYRYDNLWRRGKQTGQEGHLELCSVPVSLATLHEWFNSTRDELEPGTTYPQFRNHAEQEFNEGRAFTQGDLASLYFREADHDTKRRIIQSVYDAFDFPNQMTLHWPLPIFHETCDRYETG